MFQNSEAFAFLAVIGFVTLDSKVTFSGRGAAYSSLFQRWRFYFPQIVLHSINLKKTNNALSDQTSRFEKSRVPERLLSI